MELMNEFILVLAAVVFIFVLISIAGRLLNYNLFQNKLVLEGTKQQVLNRITELIYKCNDDNAGKIESVICSEAQVKSDQTIDAPDIRASLNPSRIDWNKIVVPYSIKDNSIVIRYENESVFVEVISGERIRN